MSISTTVGKLSGGAKLRLVAGFVLVGAGVAEPSWLMILAGLGLLASFAWTFSKLHQLHRDLEPFPMPPEMRAVAEAMARPIDPTPRRTLPPDEKSLAIAQVATTPEALDLLMVDKPPAWPWAVFASVMVQRRNAVGDRLRMAAAGYQPRPGRERLSGRSYAAVAYLTMTTILDLIHQLEQFIPSPAFKGAFGDGQGDETADAEAIADIADRLMDYHESFLDQAEECLQTPVEVEAMVFAADTGVLALCPLVDFERFLLEMCARIGQAQDLLPYTSPDTVIALENVVLKIDAPDGLMARITTHINRFVS